MATLYIIDMGGNRAVATNQADAIKQGYKWSDFGATIWMLKDNKMHKYGWVVKQPATEKGHSALPVFYKANRYGSAPVSVHSISPSGEIAPKINVLDARYDLYFHNTQMYRTDKRVSKEKMEEYALADVYRRTHNVNNY